VLHLALAVLKPFRVKWVVRTALLGLVIAGSALARPGLAELRSSARDARQQVADLRDRQSALKRQLDELAPRIESLKEQRGLVPGSELTNRLRRSQELSGELTEVARSLAAAEAEAERRDSDLLDSLSAELQRLQTAWDETARRDRRELFAVQLQALRAEREKLRAAMPLRAVPSLQPTRTAQEPEELLRQVDALRDAEDKAKQRLNTVDARIGELREEQALERRMRDFIGQQALFDDHDRRYRLSREQGSNDRPTPTSAASGPQDGTLGGRQGETPGGAPGAQAPPTPRSVEKPPQIDKSHPMALELGDSLPSLETQREKLRALAQELHERAQQLEERARAKEPSPNFPQ
jgi:chromosome segregation ATPase